MKHYHFCVSLDGALKNWDHSTWYALAEDNKCSVNEMKQFFLDEVREGKKVIPMSKECDDFDYQKGCRGHEMEEE